MTSNAEPGRSSGNATVGAPVPARSLWLHLLAQSSAAAGVAVIATSLIALAFNGPNGLLSGSFGGALVMFFFGISLLIGHFVGRTNPSGAVGLFVATYFVKVVGFAVVLFVVGEPEWLHERWFLIGAVVAVVIWQGAEIRGFSKARLQIYNDPGPAQGDSHD